MTAAALVADLAARGVRLDVANEKLRWRAPKGVVTPEDVAALQQRKAEVVEFLNEQHASRIGARWGEVAPVVEWFLASTPPGAPFKLRQGTTITDPAKFWQSMWEDIDAGPGTRRDFYGAVKADLMRLWRMFGPTAEPILNQ